LSHLTDLTVDGSITAIVMGGTTLGCALPLLFSLARLLLLLFLGFPFFADLLEF